MLEFDFSYSLPGERKVHAQGKFSLGSKLAVLGPSGCGKTTFLKTLCGLSPKISGDSRWNGASINQEFLKEGQLGFAFQASPLFNHLNVIRNICIPLETLSPYRPWTNELRTKKAEALLAKAGLTHLADRWPLDLSGGEKKRVSLLRSIIFDAPLLLLDEPFSGLDLENRQLYKKWLLDILARHEGVLVFVTHQESDLTDFALSRMDWPSASGKEINLNFAHAQAVSL